MCSQAHWRLPDMRAAVALSALLLLCTGHFAAAAPACLANPDHPFDDNADLGACKTCAPDGSECIECYPYFGLTSSGECVMCAGISVPDQGTWNACLECDGDQPDVCADCSGADYENSGTLEFGLYASEDGECLKCEPKYCIECQDINGTCTRCYKGYGLVDGDCVKCPSKLKNCEQCDGSTKRCSECRYGYSPDPETGACIACPTSCAKCSSADKCTECASGLGLDKESGECVECRVEGCSDCPTSADNCTACNLGGYTLGTDGGCLPCTDPDCTSCDAGPDTCDYCTEQSGKGPDASGACVKCTDKNCTLCPRNANKCWYCKDGWKLDRALEQCKQA